MAAWRCVSGGARSVNCAASSLSDAAACGRCLRDSIMCHPFLGVVSCLHGCCTYFICGNANSAPALAVFGQRCITALWRV